MGFDTVHPITREGLAITNLFVVVLVLSAVVLLVVLLPLGDGCISATPSRKVAQF